MAHRYVGGKSDIAATAKRYNTDNPRALELWSQTLDAMKSSPHFAMALLERDEQDRELSNFRRFASTGSYFDCSLKRSNDFFKVAREGGTMLQVSIQRRIGCASGLLHAHR